MDSPHSVRYRAMLVRLVQARRRARLTQQDVADALGIPQSRVARIETGERRIDVIELEDLARLYGRRLTWFVPRDP